MAQNMLPEDVNALIETFIRDMVSHNCAVFGLVYRAQPEPGMSLMRTGQGDPVETLDTLRQIIKSAQTDGRMLNCEVKPLN
jgi:hypothetical protein